MIDFDVTLQCTFVAKSFATLIATKCVWIRMIEDVIQCHSETMKFPATTRYVAGYIVSDAIMLSDFVKRFKFCAANVAFNVEKFPYFCIFVGKASGFYVGILRRFVRVIIVVASNPLSARW